MEEDARSSDDEDVQADLQGAWVRRDPVLVGSNISDFKKPELSPEFIATAAGYTAYDFYKKFQPDEFAELVVDQSKLYGGQTDNLKAAAQVNVDTYR